MAEDSKATRLNDTVLVPSLGQAFPAIPKSTRALIAKALSNTYSELGKLKRRANLSALNSSVQKLVEALRATGGSESEAAMTPSSAGSSRAAKSKEASPRSSGAKDILAMYGVKEDSPELPMQFSQDESVVSTQDLLSSQHVAEEENGESEAAEEDEEEEGGESEKAEEDEEQEGGESEEEEEEGAESEEEEEKEPARVELVGMAPKDAKPVLVPDTEKKIVKVTYPDGTKLELPMKAGNGGMIVVDLPCGKEMETQIPNILLEVSVKKRPAAAVSKAEAAKQAKKAKGDADDDDDDEEDDDDEAAEKPAEEFTHPSCPLSLQI